MDGFKVTSEIVRLWYPERYEIRCTATGRQAISFTPSGFQIDADLRFLRSSYFGSDDRFQTQVECLLTGQTHNIRAFRCRHGILLGTTEVLRVECQQLRRYTLPGRFIQYIFDQQTVGASNGAFFQQYVFDDGRLRKTARYSVDDYRIILTTSNQLDRIQHVEALRPILERATQSFDFSPFEDLYPFAVCFCAFAKNAGYSDYGMLAAVRNEHDLHQALRYAADNCLMILWNVSYFPKENTRIASFRTGYHWRPRRWLVDIDSPAPEVFDHLSDLCEEFRVTFTHGIQSSSGNVQLITESPSVTGNSCNAREIRCRLFQWCHLRQLRCDYTSLDLAHFFFLPGFPVIAKNLRTAQFVDLPATISEDR